MTKILRHLALAIPVAIVLSGMAQAQQVQAEKIPVKVQIVISKYDGDKKTSSLPYTMFVTANGDRAQINSGANVPITSNTGTVTYTNLGTSLDCTVTTESGRYKVSLNINDQFLVVPKPSSSSANAKLPDAQTYGRFSYQNGVNVKEGETKQIISAADRNTGEVVKVDVTVTLDK